MMKNMKSNNGYLASTGAFFFLGTIFVFIALGCGAMTADESSAKHPPMTEGLDKAQQKQRRNPCLKRLDGINNDITKKHNYVYSIQTINESQLKLNVFNESSYDLIGEADLSRIQKDPYSDDYQYGFERNQPEKSKIIVSTNSLVLRDSLITVDPIRYIEVKHTVDQKEYMTILDCDLLW